MVRDSKGAMIMAAGTTKIVGTFLAKECEALSIKEALSWLKMRQMDKCIVETSSMQVIEALYGTS